MGSQSNVGGAVTVTSRATAWTPASLSGLVAWYDASDADTITHSSGSVSQWDDKSGNANHATQSTGSKQPTTGTRTQNSLNVIDFDGGDALKTAVADDDRTQTIILVGLADELVADQSFVGTTFTSGRRNMPLRNTGKFNIAKFGSAYLSEFTAQTFSVGTPFIVACAMDATSITWTKNGSAEETDSDSTTFASGAGTTEIGADSDAALNTINGWIAELLIYNRTLDSTDRATVRDYLNGKWQIY